MICEHCGSPFGEKSGPTCDYRRKTPAAVRGGWDAPCECNEYAAREECNNRQWEWGIGLTVLACVAAIGALIYGGLP